MKNYEAAFVYLAKSPEKFWSKVTPVTESGCWLWMNSVSKQGYGMFGWRGENRKGVAALTHRIAWMLLRGPIPEGLVLDHLCKVTCCVNPAHLEPVTQCENYWRSDAREGAMAYNASITHCPQGHEYTPGNTMYRLNRGYKCRRCRTCERIRWTIRNRRRVFGSVRLNRRVAA